ncbi:AraC family transcriptional regulator [Herbaspirillum sp. Sphag1AN]|uniref:AraC family transcriptional regulator n=1 Tax=unclassified Herbaspirillum TaxID=2624150 RepID=UPI00161E03D2|nr:MULTISPECIES: GyrI-like domain-containing protein [unclassified Herbaspirillum]MBB3212906.1 AraC family transcriptional regulator [Herbaspirillum sp. Sphag1AN]MBB3246103.1 AraC family transcriptional regulator [Herbaspirillum sp. Sphag64]
MPLQILDFPPARVAALRYTGPYGPALGTFWRAQFLPWCAASAMDATAICYGIGLDDPVHTPPELCRYDACVEVTKQTPIVAPAHELNLPGGRYAVFDFHGDTRDIGAAWQAMFSELLPAQGLTMDARPCFERYRPGDRTDPDTGLFSCQICVAIR